MRAGAGPGDLYVGWNIELPTHLGEGRDILPPLGLVEVERQKAAGVIGQQWVNADCVPAREVVADHLVAEGKQCPAGAVCALDLGLTTQGAIPFVRARRCIARPTRFVLPAQREDILAAAEECAKVRELGGDGRVGGQWGTGVGRVAVSYTHLRAHET